MEESPGVAGWGSPRWMRAHGLEGVVSILIEKQAAFRINRHEASKMAAWTPQNDSLARVTKLHAKITMYRKQCAAIISNSSPLKTNM
jgi:hypothetical protein